MNRPVILCGLGKVGRRVLDCLHGDGVPVVVVNATPADNLPAGVPLVIGDCRSAAVLTEAGVREARGVIVCVSDDLINIATSLTVRSLNADVRIVVRTFSPNLVTRLSGAIKNVVPLSVSGLVAPLLALIARTGSALGTVATPDGPQSVVEMAVADTPGLVGRAIGAVGVTPVAFFPAQGSPQFLWDVPGDRVLASGDRLIACGPAATMARLTRSADDDRVHWAGWPRRAWRVFARFRADMDRPLRICALLLLSVLAGSTILYALITGEGLASAFYHTISVMANAPDKHAEQLGGFAKVFAGLLRVTGTALLAAFTAIFTNYHVRARLGGALELHRVPEAGHVVLCGLGNVGFRVMEELLRADQSVVVVEPNRDGRFIASARRLGAAVIVGDATVAEVLRQARVDTACAVIATANADLINVEIALLVREIAPRRRIIVRVTDADLARVLREAADVKLAISLPALAAPAFVAALYGDRVQAVFLAGGRLLLAVEICVEPGEACVDGARVRALAIDYNLMPLALSVGGKPVTDVLERKLGPGDRLTVIATPADLDRLYRRERPAADYAVVVDAFPLTARDGLVAWLRGHVGLSKEDAEKYLAQLPATLTNGLSRGAAEDLLARLRRERISARAAQSTGVEGQHTPEKP